MSNVVYVDFSKKPDPKSDREAKVKELKDNLSERIERVKASIQRINKLMDEVGRK